MIRSNFPDSQSKNKEKVGVRAPDKKKLEKEYGKN
jgi:hypothetical protein